MLSFQGLAQTGAGSYALGHLQITFFLSLVDSAVVSSNSCTVQLAAFLEILSGSPICVTWTGLHHTYIYAIQVGLTYLFLPVTHFSAQEAWWDDGPKNANSLSTQAIDGRETAHHLSHSLRLEFLYNCHQVPLPLPFADVTIRLCGHCCLMFLHKA